MLKVNAISKTFNPGTVNEKKALSALSLHLEAGDFVTAVSYTQLRENTRGGAETWKARRNVT